MKKLILFTIIANCLLACQSDEFLREIQLTMDTYYNHDLDNNDNFSPDDQWLVYDTRTESGGIGACGKIEKVNVQTGEKVVLYELPQNKAYGPGVGAVSYSHTKEKVIFIHGLMNASEEKPYQQWRRTGVMVEDAHPNTPIFMDARDVTYPFTPGALRGGTHRHEWSGDGNWIGFTYNDAIMKQLEDSTGQLFNLRTIGVSKKIQPVQVDQHPDGENISGKWFSVLVVRVVPNPTPGSDEISRAAGDSWVGKDGYVNNDGEKQVARAFIGTIRDKAGKEVDEVFIVDIPNDISKAGPYGPLEGAKTSMPAPPLGTSQSRLTFTAETDHPGCIGIVRSSPDGSTLAYRADDKNGINQIFTISPLGGAPVQQTIHASDVQSGARWHPDGKRFFYVWNNSIIMKSVGDENFTVLTKPSTNSPTNLVVSHDGALVAYNRLVPGAKNDPKKQIFLLHLNSN